MSFCKITYKSNHGEYKMIVHVWNKVYKLIQKKPYDVLKRIKNESKGEKRKHSLYNYQCELKLRIMAVVSIYHWHHSNINSNKEMMRESIAKLLFGIYILVILFSTSHLSNSLCCLVIPNHDCAEKTEDHIFGFLEIEQILLHDDISWVSTMRIFDFHFEQLYLST